jgi:hypothetical protein
MIGEFQNPGAAFTLHPAACMFHWLASFSFGH